MKFRADLFVLLSIALLTACSCSVRSQDRGAVTPTPEVSKQEKVEEPVDVSLIQLISTPEVFNGKQIRTIGFARLEFEGNAIYLHSEDAKQAISKNGIWVDVPDEFKKDTKNFNGKYLIVQGTFDAVHKGHLGMYSGSLTNVSRFRPWSSGIQD